MVAVYVDDIVLAGKSDRKMSEVKNALASRFNVKDMGELHYLLGVKIIQDEKDGKSGSVNQHMQRASCRNSLWRMQSWSAHQLILEQR